MSTGQFSGKPNTPPPSNSGKDPRGSVALKDPRATASSRPVTVPTPQRAAEGGGGKFLAIGLLFVVIVAIAGVAFAATSSHRDAAEQTQKEDTVNANNELLVKLGQMQNTMNQMQTMISQQDMTIKQMRSEIQSCKNSVESVRSAYLTMQSKGLQK